MSSNFQNNWGISFFFSQNPILFWNNSMENIGSTNNSLFYVNNSDINMTNSSFENFYFPSLSIVQEVEIWTVSPSLISSNSVPQTSTIIVLNRNIFRNITGSILFDIELVFNFTIVNNIFENFYLSGPTMFRMQGVLNNLS